ncbi:Transcriptional regulator GlxA family, contains an amidase domain and an AraC-type DNA-binding HTH domain [Collimonas sp. OK242]|jgi:transcriptional regulator GlxA family with amidase domain|uniref:GlxA family transcriptional regulator n=1 Tax=Collimonas sp. OK242 TaxID=1798195 RepID=UPI00089C3D97|nr:GlxA family transcriptional regulator [Collimonas sp. OK242]SDX24671.1 Transcriptional regulator GlxA family, contains an amidase domain and an AraC-type DNA-binding HTH domain [Collimonas sp. OK242]
MRRIGFVLIPGFQLMYMAALSVFEFANISAGKELYEIEVLSETGGLIPSSHGMMVQTEPFGEPTFDTVIFGGGMATFTATPGLVDFAVKARESSRRVASICTGVFILAQAGILDGRRATTHWLATSELKEGYPKIKLEPDRIFTIDGPVWTSAGMSAGIDLALEMVEKDFGRDLARSVAKKLVLSHRRAGGQLQHSELLDMDARSDRVQSSLDFARRNLKKTLTVDDLAEAANLSRRQFSRVFHSETGQSPAKAIEHLRVEAARLMLEQSRHSIEVIAAENGFVDSERMRRAFLRICGQPPQVVRRNARMATEEQSDA